METRFEDCQTLLRGAIVLRCFHNRHGRPPADTDELVAWGKAHVSELRKLKPRDVLSEQEVRMIVEHGKAGLIADGWDESKWQGLDSTIKTDFEKLVGTPPRASN